MQIGSSSRLSLPIAVDYRRDGVADSTRQPRDNARAAQRIEEQPQREVTRIPARAATRSYDSAASDRLQELPSRSRSALQTYLDNGPTIQERLGVELAGVDVFV